MPTKSIKKVNKMNNKNILIGVGVIALLGVGYLAYRRMQTTSQDPEKNRRRIRIIGKRNVTPEVTEEEEEETQDTEL